MCAQVLFVCLHMLYLCALTFQNVLWHVYASICDRIRVNMAYWSGAHLVQCTFLVPHGRISSKCSFCHICVKEPFYYNLCHRLRRISVSFEGETSHPFDLPSLSSCQNETRKIHSASVPSHVCMKSLRIYTYVCETPFCCLDFLNTPILQSIRSY